MIVVGILGADQSGWSLLQPSEADVNCIGHVVLTGHHRIATYRRAFQARAAVASIDSKPDAVADVVVARLRGEVVAPAGVLAACLDDEPKATLSPGERTVLVHISQGLTVTETAERTFYSERHVRRLLQSILAKANTADRQEAVLHFDSELRQVAD